MHAVPLWVVTGLAVLLFGFGIVLIDRLWPPTPRDVSWLAGRADVPDDETRVLRRYLQRHRVHRFVGGLLGVLAAFVVSMRWDAQVELDDLLFWGLAGVLLGMLSAESFRLGARSGATVVASLEPHEPAPRPELVRAARVLLALAAAGAVAMAAAFSDAGAVYLAVAGGAVLGVAELTRARIVGRRRPVLSDRARSLDARIRRFAGESVARLELAMAVLVAGGVLGSLPSPPAVPTWVGTVRAFGALGCFVAAVVLARRASPRPPRAWRAPP